MSPAEGSGVASPCEFMPNLPPVRVRSHNLLINKSNLQRIQCMYSYGVSGDSHQVP